MPSLVLDLTVDGSDVYPVFRGFTRMVKLTLQDVAWEWHKTILKKHFTSRAASEYGHSPRSPFYREIIKKTEGRSQGRWLDLWLRGKSRRYMIAFRSVTGTSRRATLRMQVPSYFTKPFVGVIQGADGRQRRIGSQPNKPAEITALSARDREHMRQTGDQRLQRRLNIYRAAASTGTN